MLSEIITYLDSLLSEIVYIPKSKGLVEKYSINGKEIPSLYCKGEWKALNVEDNFIYHRLVGSVLVEELEEDQQTSCEPWSQKDYPMRLVFCKKKIGKNTIFTPQSVGEDIANSIHILNNKSLCIQLKADTVQVSADSIETSTTIAFPEEFGLDTIPLDYIFIYVDYTITITGANSCFKNLCQPKGM